MLLHRAALGRKCHISHDEQDNGGDADYDDDGAGDDDDENEEGGEGIS